MSDLLSSHPQLAALAAMLLGMLLIKILPAAWPKLVASFQTKGMDAIQRSAYLAAHVREKSAAILFMDHAGLFLRVLGQKVIADAKANGKIDATLALQLKTDLGNMLRSLLSQQMVIAAAQELGFIYATPQASLDALLAYAGAHVDAVLLAAAGGSPTPAPAPGGDVPPAEVPAASPLAPAPKA